MENAPTPILRPEKDRQTTRLIILKNQKGTITHVRKNIVIEHKPMALSKNFVNKSRYLNDFTDLRNIKALEIYINDGATKKVDFPQAMLDRLKNYLARPKDPNVKYDCADFAHEMNGMKYEHANVKPEEWDISAFDGNMIAGETILVTSKDKPAVGDYAHFAIFVSDGLYMSKFGNIGKISITGLEEIKKFYNADFVFKIKPKAQTQQ